MRAGILLSVREKATRLPGKVLLPFGSMNVTEHLVQRLKQSVNADAVVIATSADERDVVFEDLANRMGVRCFRGSLDDKLRRYGDAADAFGFDFVIVVDGDDPFVSVSHIDRLIDYAKSNRVDYVIFDGLPVGATGFGVSMAALRRACEGRAERNTEIWGHIFLDDDAYRSVRLDAEPQYRRPDIRMTLDYPEDYQFFTTVLWGIAAEGNEPSFENVMDYLSRHADAIAINAGVQSAYEEHVRKSMPEGA